MTNSESSVSSISDSSSSSLGTPPSSVPSSPTNLKSGRSNGVRLDPAPDEVDPISLIGKTLIGVRRSPTHPNVVLLFSDKSSFQIRVDGYNPQYPGIKKEIELSQRCAEVFPARGGSSSVELTIDHCASISMLDKAFDARGSRECYWEQSHRSIAFKFKQRDGWHCVWAMLAENEEYGQCIFRNFEDVYLARSPPRHKKKRSQA